VAAAEGAVPAQPGTSIRRQVRQRSLGVGILLHGAELAGGIVLAWAALVPGGHLAGIVKVPLVLVAVFLAFRGVDGLLKVWLGAAFDTGFWLSGAWLVVLVAAAATAGLLPLPDYQNPSLTINTPGYARPDLFSRHPLGTNAFGLDLLARAIYGARETLVTCTLAALVGLIIGCAIGMSAGYFRGWWEQVAGVITDSLLSFPALLLLFAVVTVLGTAHTVPQAVFKDGTALALLSIPVMTRLARANTLTFSQREFVLAARAIGRRDIRILAGELLPNVVLPMISFLFILVATLIVAEGALAFLGLGLQEPAPSWGNMIAEGGLSTLQKYPFVPLVPGVFMFLTVYSLNRVGQTARMRWGR
jgi:peptide/nickel transport system permease protein